MLQAIEIAPRPQPEPHNEENKIKAIVKEEVVVSDVNSDEEKERELLVHVNLCCSIYPIYRRSSFQAQLESVRNRKRAKRDNKLLKKKVKTERDHHHFVPKDVIDLTI